MVTRNLYESRPQDRVGFIHSFHRFRFVRYIFILLASYTLPMHSVQAGHKQRVMACRQHLRIKNYERIIFQLEGYERQIVIFPLA